MQLLIMLHALLLLTSTSASSRNGAFVGYKEASSPPCVDDMDSAICISYAESGMCRTGYVASSCKKTCKECTAVASR